MALIVSAALLYGCPDNSAVVDGRDVHSNNQNNDQCVDPDGDGFGINCPAGPDCDENNPNVHLCDCGSGDFEGCPCASGEVVDCFDGASSQIGVGDCRAGTRHCVNGEFGSCEGQVAPESERCDGKDNDCDNVVDNGVVNACGNCDEECRSDQEGGDGPGSFELDDDNSSGVREDPDGALVLDEAELSFDFMWIANSTEGTISKVDTRTGHEVGRYTSTLQMGNGFPRPLDRCNGSNQGACPSRTAVDLRGNVWLANRAFGQRGSATKIAHRDCIDRNEDDEITTSSDVNNNNRIGLNDASEFKGVNDECILFTVPIGDESGGIPRAVAIDPFDPRQYGSAWIGAYNERRFYKLHGQTGQEMATVDVPLRPYGAVMDRHRRLWTTSSNARDDGIVYIDSETYEVSNLIPFENTIGCQGSYGIAVDGKDRIWLGGYQCEAAYRYDPNTNRWFSVMLPAGSGMSRGIAVDKDGWVYTGHSHVAGGSVVANITRFRADDASGMQVYALPGGSRTIGVGLDFHGHVWGINHDSNNATRVNLTTGEAETFPVGTNPYTYSDFTGYSLYNFTYASGHYTTIIPACENTGELALWRRLSWEADTPPGTSVEFEVRSVESESELVTAPMHGPYDESPADLSDVPRGRYLEVTARLNTEEDDISPRLHSFTVAWECPIQ